MSYSLPAFDATKHDIGVDGVGFMREPQSPVSETDMRPATSRASKGEGRYDTYETESFEAQSSFGGGAGQQRLAASDSYGCGLGDGRWGRWYPARKWKPVDHGGATQRFFSIGERLFGVTGSAIDEIHTTNSWSRTAGDLVSPVGVSGNGYAFWAQKISGRQRLFRFRPDTTPKECTPQGMTDAALCAQFGNAMWAFGTYRQKADPAITQSVLNAAENTNIINWPAAPTLGNVCFVVLVIIGASGDTYTPAVSGYSQVEECTLGASAGGRKNYTAIFAKAADPKDVNVVMTGVVAGGASSITYKLYLLEVPGLEMASITTRPTPDATLKSASSSVFSSIGDPNVFLPWEKEFVLSVWNETDHGGTRVSSITPEAAFTELVDERLPSAGGTKMAVEISWKTTSAIEDTQYTRTAVPGGAADSKDRPAHITLVYRASRFDVDTDLLMLSHTLDDGITWTSSIGPTSTAVALPKSAQAAQGYLYFTTAQGLYRIELRDPTNPTTAYVAGPFDSWTVPFDAARAGDALGVYEGLFYYNLGATVRQYAQGGSGRQLWPPPDWATVAGVVPALAAGEGGVYFGSAGTLWVYDGRGFTPLASEPAAGAFGALHWHGGNLYCLGDPAWQIEFVYPSMRPDIVHTDGANFATGYLVASEMDFEKVNVLKVIRSFELQGYFVGTSPGTLELHYLTGCGGTPDPLRLGGGATSLAWVSIGSLAANEGGVKTLKLATPLVCKRLYLRVTSNVTATGYPVLQAWAANGRSVMPSSNRITATLSVSTGTRDKQEEYLYPDPAAVQLARDFLWDLRRAKTKTHFTVSVVAADGTVDSYLVTAEALSDFLRFVGNDLAGDAQLSMTLAELP